MAKFQISTVLESNVRRDGFQPGMFMTWHFYFNIISQLVVGKHLRILDLFIYLNGNVSESGLSDLNVFIVLVPNGESYIYVFSPFGLYSF